MDRQIIISIGREFGSGGHVIGEKLADMFHIPLYDQNILLDIAADRQGVEAEELKHYDEKARNPLTNRTFHGVSFSMAENVANLQFDFLKEKAESGESFVVIGRCAESVLRGNTALLSAFVYADEEFRINRTMELYGLIREEAVSRNDMTDARRRRYHNSYFPNTWGKKENYDITLNSAVFGLDGCAAIIKACAEARPERE